MKNVSGDPLQFGGSISLEDLPVNAPLTNPTSITPTPKVISVFGHKPVQKISSDYQACFGVGCPLHDCLRYQRLDGTQQFEDSDRMGTCYSNAEKRFVAYERPEDLSFSRFNKIVESIAKFSELPGILFANPCTGKEGTAWRSLIEESTCLETA